MHACMHACTHRASRRRRRAHRHVLERARVPPRRFFQPRDDVRVSRHPVSSSFTTSDADRVSFIHSPRPTRPRGIRVGIDPTPSHPVPRVLTRPRARATARTRTRSRCSRFCVASATPMTRAKTARAPASGARRAGRHPRPDAIDDRRARVSGTWRASACACTKTRTVV